MNVKYLIEKVLDGEDAEKLLERATPGRIDWQDVGETLGDEIEDHYPDSVLKFLGWNPGESLYSAAQDEDITTVDYDSIVNEISSNKSGSKGGGGSYHVLGKYKGNKVASLADQGYSQLVTMKPFRL